MARVLVAMSGGVDSSVAAALLLEQGHEVVGVTMQVWDYSKNKTPSSTSVNTGANGENCAIDKEGKGTCCSSVDVEDARSVADHLGIPFYVINCEDKFQKTVIDDFVGSYLVGKTPIPCVNCNTFLKFDHLIKKMHELECDYLATGHYAQVMEGPTGKPSIKTSSDSWKDQTYFLFTLKPEIIPRLMFPVGTWEKPKLRQYAEEKGLPVANKKDSTGICFIDRREGHAKFIEDRVKPEELKPGLLKLFPNGEVLGEHKGIHGFTYGQRKGLGISADKPLYVVKIDEQDHTVWLGEESCLYKKNLLVKDINWLNEIQDGEKIKVKIRFAHAGAMAEVRQNENGLELEFDEPQRAITPGQAAVFYRDGQLLGGGWIQ